MHNIEIEELCVEAFSEIIVGDPMYLVNMETKRNLQLGILLILRKFRRKTGDVEFIMLVRRMR